MAFPIPRRAEGVVALSTLQVRQFMLNIYRAAMAVL
jgi:hypothetical protein